MLQPEEWKIYEFITRHFLASCGKDALGAKTEVEVKFNDETFHIDGLVVKGTSLSLSLSFISDQQRVVEKNYLDVWTFEKWNDSTVPPL